MRSDVSIQELIAFLGDGVGQNERLIDNDVMRSSTAISSSLRRHKPWPHLEPEAAATETSEEPRSCSGSRS